MLQTFTAVKANKTIMGEYKTQMELLKMKNTIPDVENTLMELPSSGASLIAIKKPSKMQETPARFLAWEGPLEKGMATYSSIVARRIPWTVQSTGLQRVGHN